MISETFELWKSAFFEPAKTFAAQKKKASYKTALVWAAAFGAIYAAAVGLFSFNIMMLVFGPIGGAIGCVIGSVVASAVLYLFAKLLGGKGTFRQQYHLVTLSMAFSMLVMAVAYAANLIPLVGGAIFALILLLLGIYRVYLLTVALREAHGYGTMQAVLTWAIPLLIVLVIAVIVAVVAFALFASVIAGGMSAYSAVPLE